MGPFEYNFRSTLQMFLQHLARASSYHGKVGKGYISTQDVSISHMIAALPHTIMRGSTESVCGSTTIMCGSAATVCGSKKHNL